MPGASSYDIARDWGMIHVTWQANWKRFARGVAPVPFRDAAIEAVERLRAPLVERGTPVLYAEVEWATGGGNMFTIKIYNNANKTEELAESGFSVRQGGSSIQIGDP